VGSWKAFGMEQVSRAVYSWSGSETSLEDRRGKSDLPALIRPLRREPWLLSEDFVDSNGDHRASSAGGSRGIHHLHARPESRDPAASAAAIAGDRVRVDVREHTRHSGPHRHLAAPKRSPHAAGMGDLSRVKQWFYDSGTPALGDFDNHYPSSPYTPRDRVEEYARQWGPLSQQRALDVALAWSVINSHLDV